MVLGTAAPHWKWCPPDELARSGPTFYAEDVGLNSHYDSGLHRLLYSASWHIRIKTCEQVESALSM